MLIYKCNLYILTPIPVEEEEKGEEGEVSRPTNSPCQIPSLFRGARRTRRDEYIKLDPVRPMWYQAEKKGPRDSPMAGSREPPFPQRREPGVAGLEPFLNKT